VIVFLATALFISWLNGRQKLANESLRFSRDQLDVKVRERTAELKIANEQLRSEIAEREAAEEKVIRARTEIARIARITTMGELAASIAHELNQPLGSIVTSGDACLRWLAAKPPNLDEARQAVEAIIRDGTRASSVLVRIRGLLRRGERLRERLDINDVIREVIALLDGELRRNAASLRTELAGSLPPVIVDRVLLQQVILNLVMSAIEAMRAVCAEGRVLRIRTQEQHPGNIVVFVQDSGTGHKPLGLLLNFNEVVLSNGIRRMVLKEDDAHESPKKSARKAAQISKDQKSEMCRGHLTSEGIKLPKSILCDL
jgi:C4-dicarboxylate-specific signal transduction histidine kinase